MQGGKIDILHNMKTDPFYFGSLLSRLGRSTTDKNILLKKQDEILGPKPKKFFNEARAMKLSQNQSPNKHISGMRRSKVQIIYIYIYIYIYI